MINNKIFYSVSAIIIFLSISIVLLSINNKNSLLFSPDNSTEINGQNLIFDGLTDLQIEYSINYVKDLDKKYLFLNKNIVFTNDTRKYYDFICSTKKCFNMLDHYCGDGRGCRGFSDSKGTIYINWKYPEEVRETICHELSHLFIPIGSNDIKDSRHQIIFDIAEKGVCYEI